MQWRNVDYTKISVLFHIRKQHSRIILRNDFCYSTFAMKDFEASSCSSASSAKWNITVFTFKVGVHPPAFLGFRFIFVTLKAHFVLIVFVSDQSMLSTVKFYGISGQSLDVKQIDTVRVFDWKVFIACPRPTL